MEEKEFIYVSTLTKSRGWNTKLIEQLLGEPDKFGVNRHYKSGPPTKLYSVIRVIEAEASEAFQTYLQGREKRTIGARKAVETKAASLTAKINSLSIQIPQRSEDSLLKAAAQHYNQHQEDRMWEHDGKWDYTPVRKLPSFSTPDSFRDRICVNYLRHSTTCYDQVLEHVSGKTGKREGHQLLFRRIAIEISRNYPQLTREVERQFRERFLED